MPALFLNALKLIFLGLLYLMLFQLARAMAAHVAVGTEQRRRGAEVVIVASPEHRGLRIPMRGAIVFGRSSEADVVLADQFASDLHLRFSMQDDRVVLQDLGSTNGTYLNGRRISEPVVVSKGDTVQVGKTIMEVR